ncbi:MAG: nucleotide exchange factor GrpE [Cyanobacteriota bacterium]|nr:nucleotide exchange factor GrpE [Cyanobacteriota bacterium]MDY6359209.1 nucleotide exchange factor GrpE [Cyanobacteriota bacterium]MDY6363410.1 nucleotide exchange factor GrpE [Cyanobacteriota bacterium]MDY6382509.1 nucleotide exchange factor GrpE [Cyanobacteriota bacterium]
MSHKNSNPFENADTKDKKIDITEPVEDESENKDTKSEDKETDKKSEEKKDEPKTDEWKDKYEKLNQQYIRLAADFDNARKRAVQERENLINYGKEETLKKLLEVLDNFERGQKSLENVDDSAKIKESFDLIQKQVYDTLTKIGLEEIKAVGEDFDPNYHEAVMRTPTKDYKEHTVISELRKGYKLGDKVLRPAMVNVATAE